MEPRASDLTALREMAATHRRRRQRAIRQASEEAALARREAERLRDAFLAIGPDIEKIVLFGSLTQTRSFRKGSDIDLAVRCSPRTFLRLVAEACRSTFPVDIIDLSTADPRMLSSIEREGEVLYEK